MLDDESLTGDTKADFTRIYNEPDPRAYFRTLVPLGYQIPQNALPVFEAVLAASGRRTVLDVCCSYGINAALLRCDVDLIELAARHTDPRADAMSAAEVAAADEAFYASRLRRGEVSVLGLDVSAPAIGYGVRTGLLAAGWAEDLEAAGPSAALAAALHGVELIVCTGGVGYVGPRTFDRLLGSVAVPSQLWVVAFVLRTFSYDSVADVFARHGLVTEMVPGLTCRQRRFADRAEFEAANRDVALRGLDPAGREADGWFHADCFLTRPAAAAAAAPAAALLAEIPAQRVAGPRVTTGCMDAPPPDASGGRSQSAGGSPKSANRDGPNVVISAILPSTIRSTSSLNGRNTVSPEARW